MMNNEDVSRSKTWDMVSTPDFLDRLKRIGEHGPSEPLDDGFVRFACRLVAEECAARAQAKLDVGGVLR